MVPDVADAIPSAVLANPIIGEAARFDGAVAPSGWMLARGQTLNVADNPRLFAILAQAGSGKAATTFKLPNSPSGMIVAVSGMYPTSPTMVAQSGRHMTALDSLGPNAQPGRGRPFKPMSAKLIEERKLITSGVRVGRSTPVPVTAELAGRMHAARQDARTAAIQQLSPANRARLEAAVQNAVAGRISAYGAVAEMIPALTNGEADALLQVDDTMIQPFNPSPRQGSADTRNDAAHFLISVAFTREQVKAIAARELAANR